MKKIDIFLSLLSGLGVGLLFRSFILGAGANFPFLDLALLAGLPLLAVLGLWVSWLIGKKFLFIFQVAKFVLIGALATLVDLFVFDFFFWIFGSGGNVAKLASKAISFVIATIAKYGGNKFWAFDKKETTGMGKEFIQFFFITLVGLGVDLGIFYVFVNIIGAPLGIPLSIWTRVSVILAAFVVAIWNFLGYKFIVFKK